MTWADVTHWSAVAAYCGIAAAWLLLLGFVLFSRDGRRPPKDGIERIPGDW